MRGSFCHSAAFTLAIRFGLQWSCWLLLAWLVGFMRLYVSVCVCLYVCIYVCVREFVCMCVCIYMCVYVCMLVLAMSGAWLVVREFFMYRMWLHDVRWLLS